MYCGVTGYTERIIAETYLVLSFFSTIHSQPNNVNRIEKNKLHNLLQCTSDIVATLGHHFLATISDWPLYPT